MRAYIPSYELKVLPTLQDTLELMAQNPGVWKPFAGGTDLMVLLEAGKLAHKNFVSLNHFKELQTITSTNDTLSLGACTTFSELASHPIVQKEFPLLVQSSHQTGALAIQNRGTIGGNIANASPAADTPPVLLVYDAAITIRTAAKQITMPYSEFHLDYKRTKLGADALITHIELPRKQNYSRSFFRKVGTRKAQAISKVCAVALFRTRKDGNRVCVEDLRIALGSVAATPIRALNTERFLRSQTLSPEIIQGARNEVLKDVAPIDDIRSSKAYRNLVTQNLIADFLESLCGTG